MIRTLTIAIMATLCSVCSYGQQSFFDKYAEMDGVTSVYITKSMLSLFPKGQTNVNGVNIGNIASRLDNIQILSTDEQPIVDKLRKETSHINTRNGYEELMRVREDGEKTTIYFKDSKKDKKEFVLLQDAKNEFTIISIVGDLTLQEIQGIVNNTK
ncbi:MAG: DUF4252 domain-containing protein [Bacteroidaceae bacterium]|nr:DUF4252 domain-containing protein [Bacteroidaceae bacterium]